MPPFRRKLSAFLLWTGNAVIDILFWPVVVIIGLGLAGYAGRRPYPGAVDVAALATFGFGVWFLVTGIIRSRRTADDRPQYVDSAIAKGAAEYCDELILKYEALCALGVLLVLAAIAWLVFRCVTA